MEQRTLDFVPDSDRLHWQMERWVQGEFELAHAKYKQKVKRTMRTVFYNPADRKKFKDAISFPFGVALKAREWVLAGNLILSCEE